ncbi:MAG: hypothetical protein M1813_003839 [Trichoglossum hirsutum]|nr:MAG: hypothetical protein M1813_003839 [Trichoglossum hirsutum]
MCGPSTSQGIDPSHGSIVSSPASSDCDLTVHASCPRCHHYINKETIRIPKDFQGLGADVKCSSCDKRIMKLGRQSTHSSFASQETTHPTERTDSSGIGEAPGGPFSARNHRHSLAVMTRATDDTLGMVPEVNSAGPYGGSSAHGSFLGDGNHDDASASEGHARGNIAQLDVAPPATSTRPPSTARPTSHRVDVDVPSPTHETLRSANSQGGPGLLSRFRSRTRGLVSAISKRAGHRLSRFGHALVRNRHSPPSSQTRPTSAPETVQGTSTTLSQSGGNSASVEAEQSARTDDQQQPTEVSGQTRLSDMDGIREDSDGARLDSEPEVTATAGGGDTSLPPGVRERMRAERRRQLTMDATYVNCGCPASQHWARIMNDIEQDLQGGSTRPSTPATAGRGRSMSRHGSLQGSRNMSAERFLQRETRLSGVTVAPSSVFTSSDGTYTENNAAADENDSTIAIGHGSHAHR